MTNHRMRNDNDDDDDDDDDNQAFKGWQGRETGTKLLHWVNLLLQPHGHLDRHCDQFDDGAGDDGDDDDDGDDGDGGTC